MNPCFVHEQSFLLIYISTTAAATKTSVVAVTPIFAPTIRARPIVSLFLFTKEFEPFEENIDWVVVPRLPVRLAGEGDKSSRGQDVLDLVHGCHSGLIL